jgi:isoleucyl-tRNA synthetase
MFRELPRPVELEEEVLRYWQDARIFEKSLERTRGRPKFVFYEGPPTANGTPHNGHVLTRVIKDIIPRYRSMRGFHVDRKGGWDTHGLPVEIEVEKELHMREGGRNSREAVTAYGMDNFAKKCAESVWRYRREWEELTTRVGFWLDMDHAYYTFSRTYVQSVWWALKTLFERGLLYRGRKIVWWWPDGGTALSAGEVGEGYRDVDDPSITTKFKVRGREDTFLLGWTTTPWTVPSNTALAVAPDGDYAFFRGPQGETLVMAEALLPEGAEVIERKKGVELVGWEYEPLYPYTGTFGPGDEGRSYVVVGGSHVLLTDGTGVVHTAPAYGEDDFEMRKKEGLALIELVGPDGRFKDEAPAWLRGRKFKEADKDIIKDLKERGLLFASGTVRHSYPFSPRSKDDPLMQLARTGWFIRTTQFKDDALANSALVAWLPEHMKEGRFGDFLRNNVDWALSRERFWGTPLPVWTCQQCGEMRAFESVKELEAAGAVGFDTTVDEDLQLHRPWIDGVTLAHTCGGTMVRASEVIDGWFDSGSMPFAQWGFPHEGQEAFRENFPADFISEAIDQTRGWFYSLLMISTLLFDEETCKKYGLAPARYPHPYRHCVVLGHVTDPEGRKESKSLGNYTSPSLVLRGRMKLRVVADAQLEPGQAGLSAEQVKSIDLGPGERMNVSDQEGGVGYDVVLVPGPSRGKDTVALAPADIETHRIGASAWMQAPFDPPGADAFRWLFFAANPPTSNTRLSMRAIREGQRELHLRLHNVFSFFTIYANIAGFDSRTSPRGESTALDRWILAEVDALGSTVAGFLDDYRIYEAARAVNDFVDALSNWYVRRSRTRFWGEGPSTLAALHTLHDVLAVLTRILAPFVPFMADAMYRRLGLEGESVHLRDWPEPRGLATEDAALRADMGLIRELASLGLAARAKVGVRVRQPLEAAEVVLAQPERAAALAPLVELLRDELNVREIRFTQDAERFVTFRVKPDYPRLGKRLGKDMKACAAVLARTPGAEVRRAVLGEGFEVALPSGPILLTSEDVVVEVQPKEHFQAAGSASAVVVLHADLDDDLREEGLAREVLARIQTRRREMDLGYTDRIRVRVGGDEAVRNAAERFAEFLKNEALAVDLLVETARGDDLVDDHPFHLDVVAA